MAGREGEGGGWPVADEYSANITGWEGKPLVTRMIGLLPAKGYTKEQFSTKRHVRLELDISQQRKCRSLKPHQFALSHFPP